MKAELYQTLERASPLQGGAGSVGLHWGVHTMLHPPEWRGFGKAETVKPQLLKAAIAKKALTKKQE